MRLSLLLAFEDEVETKSNLLSGFILYDLSFKAFFKMLEENGGKTQVSNVGFEGYCLPPVLVV